MMKCDGCTMCCEVLPVPWMNKAAGEACRYCDVGVGCRIYNNSIPEECRTFRCAYNRLENAPIKLRPDKCKIIFERIKENLFLGTMHQDYPEAYKNPVIQKELITFFIRGYSVVLSSFTIDNLIIYPSFGRTTRNVYNEFQAELKKKNDSTNLYNRS